jgi:hypothetical protein
MVKPNPIRAVAVRTQDIRVRSTLIRVRSQEKWVSFWCTTLGLTNGVLGLSRPTVALRGSTVTVDAQNANTRPPVHWPWVTQSVPSAATQE